MSTTGTMSTNPPGDLNGGTMNTLEQDVAPETAPVTVTLIGCERVSGMGAVVALANVDINVGGTGFQLQGVRVLRQPGKLVCRPPVWRHPSSGKWLPGIILPGPVQEAIADAVFEAWDGL